MLSLSSISKTPHYIIIKIFIEKRKKTLSTFHFDYLIEYYKQYSDFDGFIL